MATLQAPVLEGRSLSAVPDTLDFRDRMFWPRWGGCWVRKWSIWLDAVMLAREKERTTTGTGVTRARYASQASDIRCGFPGFGVRKVRYGWSLTNNFTGQLARWTKACSVRCSWASHAGTTRLPSRLCRGAVGLSKSTVSREFKKATTQQLKAFQERDLSPYDVVALFLDGKSFAEDEMVIALGVTLQGGQGVPGVCADRHGERSGHHGLPANVD